LWSELHALAGLPNRVLLADHLNTRVWCKPKVNMRTGAVIYVEAFLR